MMMMTTIMMMMMMMTIPRYGGPFFVCFFFLVRLRMQYVCDMFVIIAKITAVKVQSTRFNIRFFAFACSFPFVSFFRSLCAAIFEQERTATDRHKDSAYALMDSLLNETIIDVLNKILKH